MNRKSSVGSLRPRNLHVVAMRARKQGVHEKTNKALRVSARIAFLKNVLSDHPAAAMCDVLMIGRSAAGSALRSAHMFSMRSHYEDARATIS